MVEQSAVNLEVSKDSRSKSIWWLPLKIVFVCLGAACGGFIGLFFSVVYLLSPNTEFEFLAIYSPLPHHVPKSPSTLSLRFAMVHDVIHERYAKHSEAYYRERNRLTQLEIDQLSEDDRARWPLIDDLCVGLDRLGQPADAIPMMRAKLIAQQKAGLQGLELYTSLANLGTFLIHANFQGAQGGDPLAIKSFEEGLQFIRQAVDVNPNAHFGREKWQLEIATFLLKTFTETDLLQQTDCLGNSLSTSYEEIMDSEQTYFTGFGKASTALHYTSLQSRVPEFFPPEGDLDEPAFVEKVQEVRETITKVGNDETPVPFDQPMLGIIGMWREGGGANPHFSLAIAETMLRVGQRYIAWNAYERTKLLADRYSQGSAINSFLDEHCDRRQREIERSFEEYGPILSPANHPEYDGVENTSDDASVVETSDLREEFENELEFGRTYQRDYQAFEAAQIDSGVPLDSPAFYGDFYNSRPSIATKPGREELMYYVPKKARNEYMNEVTRKATLFFAATGAFVFALIVYLLSQFPLFKHRD